MNTPLRAEHPAVLYFLHTDQVSTLQITFYSRRNFSDEGIFIKDTYFPRETHCIDPKGTGSPGAATQAVRICCTGMVVMNSSSITSEPSLQSMAFYS